MKYNQFPGITNLNSNEENVQFLECLLEEVDELINSSERAQIEITTKLAYQIPKIYFNAKGHSYMIKVLKNGKLMCSNISTNRLYICDLRSPESDPTLWLRKCIR